MAFKRKPAGSHRALRENLPTQFAIIVCLLLAIISDAALAASGNSAQLVVREYVEAVERARYGQLLAEFGRDKLLPAGYELQALLASS